MPLSIEQRAALVEAVIFDVDGVLTRGEIVYGPGGGELKIFNVQDGHGFILAKRAGLKVGLLTGRTSDAVACRARDLGVDLLEAGAPEKGPALRRMLDALGVSGARACFVGDDLPDLAAMREVGFPVAVANAVPEVKARAAWTTGCRGGEGAAREVLEMVLKARGLWEKVVRNYMEAEGDA